MIGSSQLRDVRLGSEVKRSSDGAILRVSGKYQDRDGGVRLLCKRTGLSEGEMIDGSELEFVNQRNEKHRTGAW